MGLLKLRGTLREELREELRAAPPPLPPSLSLSVPSVCSAVPRPKLPPPSEPSSSFLPLKCRMRPEETRLELSGCRTANTRRAGTTNLSCSHLGDAASNNTAAGTPRKPATSGRTEPLHADVSEIHFKLTRTDLIPMVVMFNLSHT